MNMTKDEQQKALQAAYLLLEKCTIQASSSKDIAKIMDIIGMVNNAIVTELNSAVEPKIEGEA